MKHLDLFSGIGGFKLRAARVRFDRLAVNIKQTKGIYYD